MCCCPDAFLSLRSCAIEVVGVSGSLPIFGVGTAMFVVRTISDLPVVVLIHNCLLSQGGPFNLLSVSHFQASRQNSVDFNSDSPNLTVTSPTGHAMFLLDAQDGLYSFLAEPIHPSDDRYRSLPRFDLTSPDGLHGGAPTVALLRSSSSLLSAPVLSPTPLGRWSCRVLLGSTLQHRILAFPMTTVSDFDSELRTFCNDFYPLWLRHQPVERMILATLCTWRTSPLVSWGLATSVSVVRLS